MKIQQAIELLESLGFEEFEWLKDGHYNPKVISVNRDEFLYIGNKGSRNCIYIKLIPLWPTIYDKDHCKYEVWILPDIGDDAVYLPFRWAELSADWLTHLVMAFELKGFNE